MLFCCHIVLNPIKTLPFSIFNIILKDLLTIFPNSFCISVLLTVWDKFPSAYSGIFSIFSWAVWSLINSANFYASYFYLFMYLYILLFVFFFCQVLTFLSLISRNLIMKRQGGDFFVFIIFVVFKTYLIQLHVFHNFRKFLSIISPNMTCQYYWVLLYLDNQVFT